MIGMLLDWLIVLAALLALRGIAAFAGDIRTWLGHGPRADRALARRRRP